jgi:GNAT superfamily N-acetyltransferase
MQGDVAMCSCNSNAKPLMAEVFERHREGFTVSTDPARIDARAVHAYLSEESYWARGVPFDVVERSLQHSLCFGLYDADTQIGLARVITDHATFAYLCDVYVATSHQGNGLGKWLMECVMEYPSLQRLRRFMLRTKDAHGLYRRYGFTETTEPERWLELVKRNLYPAP